MENRKRPLRKFTAIAKIGYDVTAKQNIMVKYKFNDLDNFIKFMQRKWQPLYINIFYLAGAERGKLVYTWGRKKGLQPAN